MRTNIALIGMPGSGKTTLGKMVAQLMSMDFLDMDDDIVEHEGRTIAEMFAEGEEIFRQAESRCVSRATTLCRTVISTGGGIVKRPQNMDSLSSSSVIIFVNRPPESIAADIVTSTRPLMQSGPDKVYSLYAERLNLYRRYCHIEVANTGALKETAVKIASVAAEEIGKELQIEDNSYQWS